MKTRLTLTATLILCTLNAGPALAEARVVNAERLTENIALDGVFRESAWEKAKWESGFFELRRVNVRAKAQTKVAVLYGARSLYVGVIAEDPTAANIVANISEDERNVFNDDSIELFINPHAYQDDRYFWFCFNSLGARADGKGLDGGSAVDRSWDGVWKVAARVGSDRWTAEVEIPFYVLELDDSVEGTWRFNVARNHRSGGATIYSTLNPLERGFQDPAHFGLLAGLDEDVLAPFAFELGRPSFKFQPQGERTQVRATMLVKNESGTARSLVAEGYLISPSEAVAVDESPFEIGDSEEKEVRLTNYLLSEAGRYRFMFNLRDRTDMRTVALRTHECEVSSVPVVVEIVKPAYRDTIYATAPLSEVEVRIRLRESPSLLRERRLVVALERGGGERIAERTISEPERSELHVSFPAEDLAEGEYVVAVTLLDKAGKDLFGVDKPFRKLPRAAGDEVVCDPVTGRVVLVNGRPFMPVGWAALNPTQMKAATRAGFNSIFHYYPSSPPGTDEAAYVDLRLDTAAKYGLKTTQYAYPDYQFVRAIARSPRTRALTDQQKERIRKAVENYRDHPGLFAWYLADEPESSETNPTLLREVKRLVADCDPYHPTFIVNNSPFGHHTYKECADIFAPDVYSFHRKGKFDYDFTRERVVASLDAAFEATRGRKPVWVIFEAFNAAATGTNFADARGLTFEEYRVLVHLAIIHRANGFFFYKADSPYAEYPELKIGLEKFLVPMLRSLAPVILFGNDRQLKVSSSTGKVHALLLGHQGDLYLFAANAAAEPADVTFEAEDLRGKVLRIIGERGEVRCGQNAFERTFAGHEAHVYTTLGEKVLSIDLEEVRAAIGNAVAALRKKGNLAYADPLRPSAVVTNASSIDGQHDCHLVTDGMTGGQSYWQDRTRHEFPDWIEVRLAKRQTIARVIVYTPNLRDYELQCYDGDSWETLDSVTGNVKTTVTHRFRPVPAERVRLLIHAVNPLPPYTVDGVTLEHVTRSIAGFSRVHEIEVYEE